MINPSQNATKTRNLLDELACRVRWLQFAEQSIYAELVRVACRANPDFLFAAGIFLEEIGATQDQELMMAESPWAD